jgi:hypothetical protein
MYTYIHNTHALSPPLSGQRPGVTGGRGVTPRGIAEPPGPPGAVGCRWLRTHHSCRLPARYGWQGHLRSRTVLTHKKKALSPKVEVSQIFLRDTHVLPKLVSYEEHCRQVVSLSPSYCSQSGVSGVNPLVAFYNIHGGKREVLIFYFVPDTTRNEMYETNNKAWSITLNNISIIDS